MRAFPLLFLLAIAGCGTSEAPVSPQPPPVGSEWGSREDERFIGYWNQRFELRPDPDRDEAEKKLQLKMTEAKTATFRFEKGGAFVSESMGFANKGTWKSTGNSVTLTVTSGPAFDLVGKPYDFILLLDEDGSLQGAENGYAWHLTRITE